MVSDRRLTRERDGKLEPIEEEASKPAILLCRDARVVVAYTGLASIGEPPNRGPAPPGTFRTAAWLLDALAASAAPERTLLPLVDRFRDRAEAKFEALPLKHPLKPLAVLFAGYGYVSPTDARPTRRTVANFTGSSVDSSARFAVTETDPGHGGAYMLALGTRRAITDKHVQAVQHLIAEGRPPQALVGKLVDILRTVAADPKSRGAIGTQCDSVILPADAWKSPVAEYHTARASTSIPMLSLVEVRGGEYGEGVIMDPAVHTGNIMDPEDPHRGTALTGPSGASCKFAVG